MFLRALDRSQQCRSFPPSIPIQRVEREKQREVVANLYFIEMTPEKRPGGLESLFCRSKAKDKIFHPRILSSVSHSMTYVLHPTTHML
jgi:hypothetical protein